MRSSYTNFLPIVAALTISATLAGCAVESSQQSSLSEGDGGVKFTASFDGLPIAYKRFGSEAFAVVFVHGWSCDQTYWDAQVRSLSESHTVVTVDLAGHGQSGDQRDSWTIASYGADVASVVAHLGLESVVLVGHSMGGDVIVDTARLLTGQVKGLVWIDTYGRFGEPRTNAQVADVLARFESSFADSTYTFVRSLFPQGSDEMLVERVANDMAAAPPHVALASLRSSITNDRVVPPALDKLGLPVVSLNPASYDPDVESLARHDVQVILVPEVGHFMMMEDPEMVNDILNDVINRMLTEDAKSSG